MPTTHHLAGTGLTIFAFVGAYRALRRGDSKQANRMFRARVLAQGFTVLAMLAGSLYYSRDREKTKELRQLQEQRDAEEKRQKWIRELEVRDEEDRALRARMQRMRQQAEAQVEHETAPADGQAQPKSTGGIIGRIGLWSKGEEKKALEEAADDKGASSPAKSSSKEVNTSSLGTLGEMFASSKKKNKSGAQSQEGSQQSNEGK